MNPHAIAPHPAPRMLGPLLPAPDYTGHPYNGPRECDLRPEFAYSMDDACLDAPSTVPLGGVHTFCWTDPSGERVGLKNAHTLRPGAFA